MTSSLADEKTHGSFREDVEEESAEVINYKKSEAALLRKLDIFIAPIMMLLMLISYLDRGNIGFAATQGMITDIHLKGSQLNVSVVSYSHFASLTRLLDRHFCFLHLLYSCRGKSSKCPAPGHLAKTYSFQRHSSSSDFSSTESFPSLPSAGALYACALDLFKVFLVSL